MGIVLSEPPVGMVECDRCNPLNPECDESGRPYTCYCCGDSGWMPEAAQWDEPQILAELRNPQQHFMARYPSPPARYLRPRQLHYGYSTADDDDIPF